MLVWDGLNGKTKNVISIFKVLDVPNPIIPRQQTLLIQDTACQEHLIFNKIVEGI